MKSVRSERECDLKEKIECEPLNSQCQHSTVDVSDDASESSSEYSVCKIIYIHVHVLHECLYVEWL